MVECPKCGYFRKPDEAAPSWECPACGIVYEKFKHRKEDGPVTDFSREFERLTRKPKENPRGIRRMMEYAGLFTAVLALIRGLAIGGGLFSALLLFPFFLCLVTVLSMTFGDGLYIWNRYQMGFERFDSEAHPIQAGLVYVVSIIGCLFFAGFFFLGPL